MKNLESFSDTTIEALKFYVYALVDISTNKICYIGKGQKDRVLKSLKAKNNISNNTLQAYIIRHGLETEEQALMLEATLINFINYFNISDLENLVEGHDTNGKGITTIEDIELEYTPKIITKNDFQHNILLISIKPSYDTFNKPVALYERTRKCWSVDINKVNNQIDYVIATYQGVLKEIYKAHEWREYKLNPNSPFYKEHQKNTKYEFIGDVVEDPNIRDLYLGKKLSERLFWGNSIRYIINQDISAETE